MTPTDIRLPIRRNPYSKESLNSYITGLASMNGLDRARWIPEAVGVRFPRLWQPSEALDHLGAMTGTDRDRLSVTSPEHCDDHPYIELCKLGHIKVAARWLVRKRRRVCIACLESEEGYGRIEWGLRFVETCHRHGMPLIDACSHCDQKLTWHTGHISTCRCGYDLRRRQPPHLNQRDQNASAFVADVVSSDCDRPIRRLNNLRPYEIIEVATAVAAILNLGFRIRPDDGVNGSREIAIYDGGSLLSKKPEAVVAALTDGVRRLPASKRAKAVDALDYIELVLSAACSNARALRAEISAAVLSLTTNSGQAS
jgi:hypothetical protein